MAQAKTEFRLLMSPLSRTIYAGRVKDIGGSTALSVGVRHDVTNDFLSCVMQLGEAMGGKFAINNEEGQWEVTVTKRAAQAAQGGE